MSRRALRAAFADDLAAGAADGERAVIEEAIAQLDAARLEPADDALTDAQLAARAARMTARIDPPAALARWLSCLDMSATVHAAEACQLATTMPHAVRLGRNAGAAREWASRLPANAPADRVLLAAEMLVALGQPSDALATLSAHTTDGSTADLATRLEVDGLLAAGRVAEASARLGDVDHPEFAGQRAAIAVLDGRPGEALAIIAASTATGDSWAIAAWAHLALGDAASARAAVEGKEGIAETWTRAMLQLDQRVAQAAAVELFNASVLLPDDPGNALLRAQVLAEGLGATVDDAGSDDLDPLDTLRDTLGRALTTFDLDRQPLVFRLQDKVRAGDGRYAYFRCELQRAATGRPVASELLDAVDAATTTRLQDAALAEMRAERAAADGDGVHAAAWDELAIIGYPDNARFAARRLACAERSYSRAPSSTRAVSLAAAVYAHSTHTTLPGDEATRLLDQACAALDEQLAIAGNTDIAELIRLTLWIRTRRVALGGEDVDDRAAAVSVAPLALLLNPGDAVLLAIAAQADGITLRSTRLIDTAAAADRNDAFILSERVRLHLNYFGSASTVTVPAPAPDDPEIIWYRSVLLYQHLLAGDVETLATMLGEPTADASWARAQRAEALALVRGTADGEVLETLAAAADEYRTEANWFSAAAMFALARRLDEARACLAEARRVHPRRELDAAFSAKFVEAASTTADLNDLAEEFLDLFEAPSTLDELRHVQLPIIATGRGEPLRWRPATTAALQRRFDELCTSDAPATLVQRGPLAVATYAVYDATDDEQRRRAVAAAAALAGDDLAVRTALGALAATLDMSPVA